MIALASMNSMLSHAPSAHSSFRTRGTPPDRFSTWLVHHTTTRQFLFFRFFAGSVSSSPPGIHYYAGSPCTRGIARQDRGWMAVNAIKAGEGRQEVRGLDMNGCFFRLMDTRSMSVLSECPPPRSCPVVWGAIGAIWSGARGGNRIFAHIQCLAFLRPSTQRLGHNGQNLFMRCARSNNIDNGIHADAIARANGFDQLLKKPAIILELFLRALGRNFPTLVGIFVDDTLAPMDGAFSARAPGGVRAALKRTERC